MNFRDTLLATVASAGLAVYALPAKAEPSLADGICPAVSTASAGCDLVITFNANGSITTTAGASSALGDQQPGTYDNSDDTLIGVVNNSGSTITSFTLASKTQNIFGFDGDGIDGYDSDGVTKTENNPDTTGYGGPDAYFNNITTHAGQSSSSASGTVNFANGGIANGASDYFSLEGAVSLDQAPTVNSPVPEPVSMAILGVGMFGAGIARRFRRKA